MNACMQTVVEGLCHALGIVSASAFALTLINTTDDVMPVYLPPSMAVSARLNSTVSSANMRFQMSEASNMVSNMKPLLCWEV